MYRGIDKIPQPYYLVTRSCWTFLFRPADEQKLPSTGSCCCCGREILTHLAAVFKWAAVPGPRDDDQRPLVREQQDNCHVCVSVFTFTSELASRQRLSHYPENVWMFVFWNGSRDGWRAMQASNHLFWVGVCVMHAVYVTVSLPIVRVKRGD